MSIAEKSGIDSFAVDKTFENFDRSISLVMAGLFLNRDLPSVVIAIEETLSGDLVALRERLGVDKDICYKISSRYNAYPETIGTKEEILINGLCEQIIRNMKT